MITIPNLAVISTMTFKVGDLIRVLGSVLEGDSPSHTGKIRPSDFTSINGNTLIATKNELVAEIFPNTGTALLMTVIECAVVNPVVTQVIGSNVSAGYETRNNLVKLRLDVPVGYVCTGLIEEGSTNDYQYRVVLDKSLNRAVTYITLVNTVTGVATNIDGSHKQLRVLFNR